MAWILCPTNEVTFRSSSRSVSFSYPLKPLWNMVVFVIVVVVVVVLHVVADHQ